MEVDLSDERKRGGWGAVAAAVMCLFVAYVGGYFTIVVPTPILIESTSVAFTTWEPEYRAGGRFAEVLFGPIHKLDRKLRPNVWMEHEHLKQLP